MGLLDGKKGIIYGLRESHSAAWGIAKSLAREGATFALTYLGEREEKDVRKLAPELGEGVVPLIAPCDLTNADQIAALHEQLKETFGSLDFVIHSVAFAPRRSMEGRFIDIVSEDYLTALNVSSYTLIAAAKAAEPLLNPGASIVTLSYLGGERVIPGYNTAGIAKAALESTVRYLASELGPRDVRVNAVSAGAMNTLSGRGIPGFTKMLKFNREVAPLRRNTSIEEVGDTTAFLVSSWSRGITGHVLFVDGGYHIVGMQVASEKEASA